MSNRGGRPFIPRGQPGRGRGERGRGDGGRGGQPFESSRARGFRGDRGGGDRARGGGDRARGGGDRGGRGGRGGGRGSVGPPEIFAKDQPAVLDTNVLKTEEALVSSLKKLAIAPADSRPIPRPNFGTVGKPTKLRINLFDLKIEKKVLYEHDVLITPEPEDRRRIIEALWQLIEQHPEFAPHLDHVAHDASKRLISAKRLPKDPFIFTIDFQEERKSKKIVKQYVVTIKFIQEVQTNSLNAYLAGDSEAYGAGIEAIQSINNVVLQQHGSRHGVRIGRVYREDKKEKKTNNRTDNRIFPHDIAPFPMPAGLELHRGYFLSTRMALNTMLVNLNVCYAAFVKSQRVSETMDEFWRESSGASLAGFMRGLKFSSDYLGRHEIKTIFSLGDIPSREFFPVSGKQRSVLNHYKDTHRITLSRDDLPCVRVQRQDKTHSSYPPELLTLTTKQPFRGELAPVHMAAVINLTAKQPGANAKMIVQEGFRSLGLDGSSQILQNFGISVSKEMRVVPARVLSPPTPTYANRARKTPNAQTTRWNLQDVTFQKGSTIAMLGVLVILPRGDRNMPGPPAQDPLLPNTLAAFKETCAKSGVRITSSMPPFPLSVPHPNQDKERRETTKKIEETLDWLTNPAVNKKGKASLILIILPDNNTKVYNAIKYYCDVRLDVHSNCVQWSKFKGKFGPDPQYFANLALKINMKLGGTNHHLDTASLTWLDRKSTMLVGMDVTHPQKSTSAKGTPSVVAVVANSDKGFLHYPVGLGIQKTLKGEKWIEAKESITDLKKLIFDRLELYRKVNTALPERVLLFRDGVSEGQFAMVLNEELPLIRQALKDAVESAVQPNKLRPKVPTITLVVCAKRHHLRMYPTEEASADKKGNPLPGTVIDSGGVFDPHLFQFLLQPHAALQGAARSTLYTVLVDENGMKSDDLQTLVNANSYTMARTTGAVSLITPVYYADLACTRGRSYLQRLFLAHSEGGGGSVSGRSESSIYEEAEKIWSGGVTGRNMKDSMFYL